MSEQVTCSCGLCVFIRGKWLLTVMQSVFCEVVYCPKCGDCLRASGTIEPHTNIVKLFSAMRIIQDYKIEIYCDDDGVFQIQEQQINGRRIGLGHPMGEDLAALVLKHYPDILDAEDEMEADG